VEAADRDVWARRVQETDEPMTREPTDDEIKAVAALRRVAKRWPRSLTLLSMAGSLCVVYTDEASLDREGDRSPDMVMWYVDGIPNDGGDW